MRAIPELQTALGTYTVTSSSLQRGAQAGHPVLTRALRELFAEMRNTTDAVVPAAFVTILRQVVPQFAEMRRSGSVAGLSTHAQQGNSIHYCRIQVFLPLRVDAVECWVEITNALKALPGLPAPSGSTAPAGRGFVDQYMMCETRQE